MYPFGILNGSPVSDGPMTRVFPHKLHVLCLAILFCLFPISARSAMLAENESYATTADIDLTGIWNVQGDPRQQIRIGFPAEQFLIIANLSVEGWGVARIPYAGPYHGDAGKLPVMTEKSYADLQSSRQAMDNPPQVTIVDSEHIRIGDKNFVRFAIPEFQRPGCQDAANSTTIRPMQALRNAYDKVQVHDYNIAACWLLMGALQGGGQSSAALAQAYLEGKGFPQSNEKALMWFQQSAAQNFYLSEVNLATMYRSGIGTPVDLKKAMQWDNAAKEQAQQNAAVAAAEARARQTADVAATAALLFGLSILADPDVSSPTINFNVNLNSRTNINTLEIAR
jgi:hypothetical protein